MQITGINNMHPGNQGVNVYFDGMDMDHVQTGLALLIRSTQQHLATEDLDEETRKFREWELGVIEGLYDQFVDLNLYLDSINTNLVLDSMGFDDADNGETK